MSAERLQTSTRFMIGSGVVGLAFLGWDLWRAVELYVPLHGAWGFLGHPVFWHKVTELVAGGSWYLYGMSFNYEMSAVWPEWLSPARYGRLLRGSGIVNVLNLIPATYAWVAINLGSAHYFQDQANSAKGIGTPFWWVWLTIVIVAGAWYAIHTLPKSARFTQ
jgi:hypothetical protein